jgi:hypothetical protein
MMQIFDVKSIKNKLLKEDNINPFDGNFGMQFIGEIAYCALCQLCLYPRHSD